MFHIELSLLFFLVRYYEKDSFETSSFIFACKDNENLCNNQQISYKLLKNHEFCYKIKLYSNRLSAKTHVSRDIEQKKKGKSINTELSLMLLPLYRKIGIILEFEDLRRTGFYFHSLAAKTIYLKLERTRQGIHHLEPRFARL